MIDLCLRFLFFHFLVYFLVIQYLRFFIPLPYYLPSFIPLLYYLPSFIPLPFIFILVAVLLSDSSFLSILLKKIRVCLFLFLSFIFSLFIPFFLSFSLSIHFSCLLLSMYLYFSLHFFLLSSSLPVFLSLSLFLPSSISHSSQQQWME